jgi:hypothetical protein
MESATKDIDQIGKSGAFLIPNVGSMTDPDNTTRRGSLCCKECTMVQTRKRMKHKTTFEERLAEEARRFKEAADAQPYGSKARVTPAWGPTGRNRIPHARMAFLAGAGITEVNKDRACLMNDDGHIRAFVCGNDADAIIWAS